MPDELYAPFELFVCIVPIVQHAKRSEVDIEFCVVVVVGLRGGQKWKVVPRVVI